MKAILKAGAVLVMALAMNGNALYAEDVTPLYANHNRVPGNTPTMTNIQAWATSLIVASGISASTATNIANAVVAPVATNVVSLEHGVNTLESRTNVWNSVTNVYTKTQSDGRYLKLTGDSTINGILTIDKSSTDLDILTVGSFPYWINIFSKNPNGGDNTFFLTVFSYDFDGVYDGEGFKRSTLTPDNSPVATSNMVVAVVDDRADRAITSAVDTAMTDILGSNWRTTYGGGLAGIIAALVAALTWLKTNKLTKGMTSGVPDDPNVQSLFSSDNTLLVGEIDNGTKAPTSTSAVALQDRKTVTVTPASATLDIDFVAAKGSELRYCELIVNSAPASFNPTFEQGVSVNSSDTTVFTGVTTGSNYLFVFAETAANVWYVTRQDVKSVTITTAS